MASVATMQAADATTTLRHHQHQHPHQHQRHASAANSASSSSSRTSTITLTSASKLASLHPHRRKSVSSSTSGTVTLVSTTPLSSPALPRPIPNSYWATPLLLACEYPWSPNTPRPKLDALLLAGIRTFIDLTEPGELVDYAPQLRVRARALGLPDAEVRALEHRRFPIRDRTAPSCRGALGGIMALLRACERGARRAAVHCRGGIGRTGTVVGCWLVESARAQSGDEALRMVGRMWQSVEKCRRFPESPETGAQCEFVRTWRRGAEDVRVKGGDAGVVVTATVVVEEGGAAEVGEAQW